MSTEKIDFSTLPPFSSSSSFPPVRPCDRNIKAVRSPRKNLPKAPGAPPIEVSQAEGSSLTKYEMKPVNDEPVTLNKNFKFTMEMLEAGSTVVPNNTQTQAVVDITEEFSAMDMGGSNGEDGDRDAEGNHHSIQWGNEEDEDEDGDRDAKGNHHGEEEEEDEEVGDEDGDRDAKGDHHGEEEEEDEEVEEDEDEEDEEDDEGDDEEDEDEDDEEDEEDDEEEEEEDEDEEDEDEEEEDEEEEDEEEEDEEEEDEEEEDEEEEDEDEEMEEEGNGDEKKDGDAEDEGDDKENAGGDGGDGNNTKGKKEEVIEDDEDEESSGEDEDKMDIAVDAPSTVLSTRKILKPKAPADPYKIACDKLTSAIRAALIAAYKESNGNIRHERIIQFLGKNVIGPAHVAGISFKTMREMILREIPGCVKMFDEKREMEKARIIDEEREAEKARMIEESEAEKARKAKDAEEVVKMGKENDEVMGEITAELPVTSITSNYAPPCGEFTFALKDSNAPTTFAFGPINNDTPGLNYSETPVIFTFGTVNNGSNGLSTSNPVSNPVENSSTSAILTAVLAKEDVLMNEDLLTNEDVLMNEDLLTNEDVLMNEDVITNEVASMNDVLLSSAINSNLKMDCDTELGVSNAEVSTIVTVEPMEYSNTESTTSNFQDSSSSTIFTFEAINNENSGLALSSFISNSEAPAAFTFGPINSGNSELGVSDSVSNFGIPIVFTFGTINNDISNLNVNNHVSNHGEDSSASAILTVVLAKEDVLTNEVTLTNEAASINDVLLSSGNELASEEICPRGENKPVEVSGLIDWTEDRNLAVISEEIGSTMSDHFTDPESLVVTLGSVSEEVEMDEITFLFDKLSTGEADGDDCLQGETEFRESFDFTVSPDVCVDENSASLVVVPGIALGGDEYDELGYVSIDVSAPGDIVVVSGNEEKSINEEESVDEKKSIDEEESVDQEKSVDKERSVEEKSVDEFVEFEDTTVGISVVDDLVFPENDDLSIASNSMDEKLPFTTTNTVTPADIEDTTSEDGTTPQVPMLKEWHSEFLLNFENILQTDAQDFLPKGSNYKSPAVTEIPEEDEEIPEGTEAFLILLEDCLEIGSTGEQEEKGDSEKAGDGDHDKCSEEEKVVEEKVANEDGKNEEKDEENEMRAETGMDMGAKIEKEKESEKSEAEELGEKKREAKAEKMKEEVEEGAKGIEKEIKKNVEDDEEKEKKLAEEKEKKLAEEKKKKLAEEKEKKLAGEKEKRLAEKLKENASYILSWLAGVEDPLTEEEEAALVIEKEKKKKDEDKKKMENIMKDINMALQKSKKWSTMSMVAAPGNPTVEPTIVEPIVVEPIIVEPTIVEEESVKVTAPVEINLNGVTAPPEPSAWLGWLLVTAFFYLSLQKSKILGPVNWVIPRYKSISSTDEMVAGDEPEAVRAVYTVMEVVSELEKSTDMVGDWGETVGVKKAEKDVSSWNSVPEMGAICARYEMGVGTSPLGLGPVKNMGKRGAGGGALLLGFLGLFVWGRGGRRQVRRRL